MVKTVVEQVIALAILSNCYASTLHQSAITFTIYSRFCFDGTVKLLSKHHICIKQFNNKSNCFLNYLCEKHYFI